MLTGIFWLRLTNCFHQTRLQPQERAGKQPAVVHLELTDNTPKAKTVWPKLLDAIDNSAKSFANKCRSTTRNQFACYASRFFLQKRWQKRCSAVSVAAPNAQRKPNHLCTLPKR